MNSSRRGDDSDDVASEDSYVDVAISSSPTPHPSTSLHKKVLLRPIESLKRNNSSLYGDLDILVKSTNENGKRPGGKKKNI